MIRTDQDRILDFVPLGMRWEITHSAADTNGERFETVNVIRHHFDGPPLHIHPHAEESYAVQSGTLEVCIDGEWRQLKAGESATVPAGTPHTLRTATDSEVRMVNVHKPALDFERFFRRLSALVSSGKAKLPPKDFRSSVLFSMLFVEHQREIMSVKPPYIVMRVLAFIGRMLGYTLPP